MAMRRMTARSYGTSMRRNRSASGAIGEWDAAHAVVALDAEGVESERHEVVLTDREDEVHQLVGVVPVGERGPRRVANRAVVVQLVDRTQQGRVVGRPSWRVGARGDASHLV